MEEGQMLTPTQLQQQARQALDDAGASQSDAGRALGVSRATVSKALGGEDDASRYARVLRSIVAEYTAFEVDDVPRFQVQHKASGSASK